MSTELDRQLHATVMKREEMKERAFREEREKLDDLEVRLGSGGSQMTKEALKKIVDSDRRMYYRTLELNDKLFIHYKGWKKLENLDGWTGLKAMYAECNAFDTIRGLDNCRQLRSLFLQENCIRRISGLENCPELWNINLSSNFISRIEGLGNLRRLNTLIIAKNNIGHNGVDDCIELIDSPINSLDIQDNKIWDPDILPEVLVQMEDLRVLYMKGNPCAKRIPNYRKSTTVYCENLKYLDDRPVFVEDRRAAEAFNRGGLEEERAERRRIREEERAKHDRNMKAFAEMVENAKRDKRERDAMRAEDKYTEEDDPVESDERRMKRMVQGWKEEHADEIRDDARERAERILAQERRDAASNADSAAGSTTTASPEPCAAATPGESDEVKKEDNRKLVYEDIWDDPPPLTKGAGSAASGAYATSNVKSTAAAERPTARSSPSALGPQQAGPDGDATVAAERPTAQQQRDMMATLAPGPDAGAGIGTGAGSGRSWHDKYKAKVSEHEGNIYSGLYRAREEKSAANVSTESPSDSAQAPFSPPVRDSRLEPPTEVGGATTPAAQKDVHCRTDGRELEEMD